MVRPQNLQRVPRAMARSQDDHDGGDAIDYLPLEELGVNKLAHPPHSTRSVPEHPPPPGYRSRLPQSAPDDTRPPQGVFGRFWGKHRGVILVAVAQLFGALMNVSARLLEAGHMHPLQILFLRMTMTTAFSCIYMWRYRIPDFPFGPRGVRLVLIARGVSGFFGIYGMWYSMMYLPLAEATVITFLAPMLSGYICHVLLKDPFTRKEQLASFIALAGVVIIARPVSIFGGSGTTTTEPTFPNPDGTPSNSTTPAITPTSSPHLGSEPPTTSQRLLAILVALLGVLGAAGAYTAIRCIGKRAHALITVTYFSTWCVLVSAAALLICPALGIGQATAPRIGLPGLFPATAWEWFLLGALGACGFIMQFMLTSGIGGEKSNRATAMTYTHMLFAAGFDRWVFGNRMGVVSLVGCGMIVGSALWAVLGRREERGDGEGRKEGDVERRGAEGRGEEGAPMLSSGSSSDEEEGGEGEEEEETSGGW